jgi:hypothetical protein
MRLPEPESPLRPMTRGLLTVAVVAQLIPVWSFAYYPTVDGPAHLFIAQVLNQIATGDPTGLGRYFTTEWNFVPNLSLYLILTLLLDYFSPATVEKLIISGYLILLPLAFLYAARPLRAAPAMVVLLSLPLGLSFTLQMGFFNYSYSIVIFLIGIGYWLRIEADESPPGYRHLMLGLIAFLGFLTHIFGAAELLLAIGVAAPVLAVLRTLTRRRQTLAAAPGKESAPGPLLPAGTVARLVATAVVLLPTFLLIAWFVASQQIHPFDAGIPDFPQSLGASLLSRGAMILIGAFVAAQSRADMMVVLGLQLVLAWAIVDQLRRRPAGRPRNFPNEALAVVLLVQLAIFFAMPERMSGSGFAELRHHPFIYVVFVLWLSSRPLSRVAATAVLAVSVLTALALPALRGYQSLRFNEVFADYRTAEPLLAPGRTMMTLDLGHLPGGDLFWQPIWRVDPFLHQGKRLAMTSGAIDLGLIQARHERSLVPIGFTPGLSPYRKSLAIQPRVSGNMHDIDALAYREATGVTVDYLLVWGLPSDAARPTAEDYLAKLSQAYDLIGESDSGWMRVYRHKRAEP